MTMIRALIVGLLLTVSLNARAQDDASGSSGLASRSAGTDHAMVLRTIGAQGLATAVFGPANAGLQTDIIGIRYWFQERIGLEAGIGIALASGNNNTAVGFGFGGGVPIALTFHKHITTFIEPFADVFIFSPGSGASTLVQVDIRGDVGFEWQLGFWDTQTLALILKMGPGLRILSQNGTVVGFATSGSSVGTVFATTGGLAFYF